MTPILIARAKAKSQLLSALSSLRPLENASEEVKRYRRRT